MSSSTSSRKEIGYPSVKNWGEKVKRIFMIIGEKPSYSRTWPRNGIQMHPIVVEFASKGKSQATQLEQMQKQFIASSTKLLPLRKFKNKYHGWQPEVVEALNSYVDERKIQMQKPHLIKTRSGPKQLYLWGKGRIYKTSFIKYLFGKLFLTIFLQVIFYL